MNSEKVHEDHSAAGQAHESHQPAPEPALEPRPFTAEAFAEGAGELSARERLLQDLATRKFNYSQPPPLPHPILCLGDRIICTPGNISGIQGGVKVGKSAVIGAIVAAILNGNSKEVDTLGFRAENVKGHAVLHFDTEQSRSDHDALIRRAQRRAQQIKEPPVWFASYCITDMDIDNRKQAFEVALEEAAEKHGGVLLVIVDGIADLCVEPNDSAEAFALIGLMMSFAIKFDCSIILALHENPGSDSGKMRGHLGSQLERKAETPLRLVKDAKNGVITMWSDRARHNHIPREAGICFRWSDEQKMHVSIGSAKDIQAGLKREKFQGEVEAAFGNAESLSYGELVDAIIEKLEVVKKTAEKRVKTYTSHSLVQKDTETGKYTRI